MGLPELNQYEWVTFPNGKAHRLNTWRYLTAVVNDPGIDLSDTPDVVSDSLAEAVVGSSVGLLDLDWRALPGGAIWVRGRVADVFDDEELMPSTEAEMDAALLALGVAVADLPHARQCAIAPPRYAGEQVAVLGNALGVAHQATEGRIEHVRIVADGDIECAYWTGDELREAPDEVMAALLARLASTPSGAAPPVTTDAAADLREELAMTHFGGRFADLSESDQDWVTGKARDYGWSFEDEAPDMAAAMDAQWRETRGAFIREGAEAAFGETGSVTECVERAASFLESLPEAVNLQRARTLSGDTNVYALLRLGEDRTLFWIGGHGVSAERLEASVPDARPQTIFEDRLRALYASALIDAKGRSVVTAATKVAAKKGMQP